MVRLLNNVTRVERADVVQKALTRLTDDRRRLFALRYEDDCTQQQIADMYGVSKMAICKRLRKLQEQVRGLLPN